MAFVWRKVRSGDLVESAILVRVPVPIPDSGQTGLPADSTGVKWSSSYKLKIKKQNLKNVIVRATWTSAYSDNIVRIGLYDEGTASYVAYVEGNAGTDVESTNYTEANLTDEGAVYVRAEVTAASATGGATFDISYVVVELVYGAG